MIRPIETDFEARTFLNAVPYTEYVPEWMPVISADVFVLGVYEPHLVGCFPLQVQPDGLEIHAAFLPEYRGRFAVEAAKDAFGWIWQNTKHNLIFAEITEPHVAIYAVKCGMKRKNDRFEVERWAAL